MAETCFDQKFQNLLQLAGDINDHWHVFQFAMCPLHDFRCVLILFGPHLPPRPYLSQGRFLEFLLVARTIRCYAIKIQASIFVADHLLELGFWIVIESQRIVALHTANQIVHDIVVENSCGTFVGIDRPSVGTDLDPTSSG